MARTIKGNLNVIQSYILTTARYDFSITEKRILYRLVEMANKAIEPFKKTLKAGCYDIKLSEVQSDLFGDAIVTLSLKDVLPVGYTNYDEAKKAFKSLSKKGIEYEDEDTWYHCNFISSIKINKNTGIATLRIENVVWDVICKFSKGFHKYELLTAMQLKSVYSMRLYELVSNNKIDLTYSIDDLRKMFGLSDKYKQVNDFIKRTIEVAKKELDEVSPFTFNYELIKGKYGKITGIIFTPIHQERNHDEGVRRKELEAKLGINFDISPEIMRKLKGQCNFTTKEIKANRDTWIKAQKLIPNLNELLTDLSVRANAEADNPKGWIIGAIRNIINQQTKK